MVKVILKGEEHEVVLPRFADRKDLALAIVGHHLRGSAAAVGLCCPTLKAVTADWKGLRYDAMEYGSIAWEQLAGAGVTDREIARAGNVLLTELSAGIFPTADEVDAAEGFSSPSAGGSTT